MSESSMIGTRIRERRVINGLKQSDLARQVGISPSYLNLIEHNRRRIGGKTLIKLADALQVEPTLLSEGAEATLISALREAAGRPDGHTAELDRTEEFAGRFPGWAQLLSSLNARVTDLERTVETLTDRLAHDPHLAASLHEVISTVTAIRSTSSILVETESLEPEWQNRFHRNINEESSRLAEGAEALVRYLEGAANSEAEIRSPQDEMVAFLDHHGFHFPQLEGTAEAAAIKAVLDQDAIMHSDVARRLARDALAQYQADARRLPLSEMLAKVQDCGPDPEQISMAFDCDLPTVFRRLAALPADLVGPVGLLTCDAAGTVLFRKPMDGFAMPRDAGACALWPLFQVLGQPQVPMRRRLRQSGRGQNVVLAFAVAEQVAAATFVRPALMRGHMLLLPDADSEQGSPLQDVGSSCRICPLRNCPARREPSIIMDGF
ncbi:helix-turn-helix domain-containing protein [Roseovarius gahaiensis]|uniref:Helix-turn-helix domain-containing protein n=1 Tax=Roseovarius gahaiensis TaxID=2716691 RepID=A0A967BA66_9RHOB|nr:helix-turn-helix domain-containing protein [Roseovarius gahaiensis]NHQ74212.1 helix-turn-helix domain-containing protein [Roseovarius gahaiensis]